MIKAPATLAMLGGGQLGRYFVSAAHELGYRVIVVDPQQNCPAGLIADEHLVADYDDPKALQYLAQHCSAATTEFENVPASTLEFLAQHMAVYPAPSSVAVAQDRIREKTFLQNHGFATAPFFVIERISDFDQVPASHFPAILKTARFGYDGKGQEKVDNLQQAKQIFQNISVPCVLEKMLSLDLEVSIVIARNAQGQSECFTLAENHHTNGILDISIVPARTTPELRQQAGHIASQLVDKLDYVGVLAVEFFVCQDELLVNEIAPRPHNSGHFTIDGCITSQYEQQVRALCGLPLGSAKSHSATVMVNLLGDLWFLNNAQQSQEPDWSVLANNPFLKLHLYGKQAARPGRKMGHFVVVHSDLEEALKLAENASTCVGVKR